MLNVQFFNVVIYSDFLNSTDRQKRLSFVLNDTANRLNSFAIHSPLANTTTTTTTTTTAKKKSLLATKTPSKAPFIHANCDCLQSKMLHFQIGMSDLLAEYAQCRNAMHTAFSNMVQMRLKVKDSSQALKTTNADSLYLQTAASHHLVCTDLCDESGLKLSDAPLVKRLHACYAVLESVARARDVRDAFVRLEKSVQKQFYELVDLVAQIYGFFGLLVGRVNTLQIKLLLVGYALDHESQHNPTVALNKDTIYSQTVVNLMKAMLNANMRDEFGKLNASLVAATTATDEVVTTSRRKSTTKVATDSTSCDLSAIEKHKYFSPKPEMQVLYHLALTHYFILENRVCYVHT